MTKELDLTQKFRGIKKGTFLKTVTGGTEENPITEEITLKLALSQGLASLEATDDTVRTFRLILDIADSTSPQRFIIDDDTVDYATTQIEKGRQSPMIKGQILLFLKEAKDTKTKSSK